MSFFAKQAMPDVARQYLQETPRNLHRKSRLEQIPLVALDIEASGFEIGRDRILSVAAIDLDYSRILPATGREWLVYQPNIVANKATEIHGILPSETLMGMPEEKVLEELLERIRGAIVVGHNIWFEVRMLDEALRRNFGIGFKNPTIDVGTMAMYELQPFRKSGYINQRPPTLEDLCAHFGTPLLDRHTAEGDAYITAELFLLMCGHIRRRKGTISRKDLPLKKA